MAVELATGYISLVPSARGFARNLSREITGPLESAGADAGDRTARRFGATFVAGVGAAASRGAVAVAAGFTLAAGVGIKIAADFEQTQIAFEGILGSADRANAVLGDLRDFATKTPFEFTGLTKSAQQLLAVGFAADDIIPTMSTLGDQAATLGVGEEGISATVRALGQIKGRGKVASQELIQISEALPGFSAIGAIAEGMGVSVADAFKLVENGAVPAEQGIDLILRGMEKFPGASGAMERQSKTLNGVISTFKDTLATTAIDFITPYLPAISQGVAAFGGFIQNTAVPALQSFMDFISNTIVPGVQGLLDIFDAGGIRAVFDALGQVLQEQAPILGQKLLVLGQQFVDWVAPQIPPFLTEVANLIGAVGLWAVSDGIPLLIGALLTMAGEFANWVTDPEDGAIVQFIEALPGIISGLETWIEEDAIPAFKDGGKALGSAILLGIAEQMGDMFKLPAGASLDFGPFDVEIPEFLRKRAHGGPVRRNTPYIVGDGGVPELFVPSQSGTILPEVPIGGAGVGAQYNVTLNYPVPESEEDGVLRALRRAAAEAA